MSNPRIKLRAPSIASVCGASDMPSLLSCMNSPQNTSATNLAVKSAQTSRLSVNPPSRISICLSISPGEESSAQSRHRPVLAMIVRLPLCHGTPFVLDSVGARPSSEVISSGRRSSPKKRSETAVEFTRGTAEKPHLIFVIASRRRSNPWPKLASSRHGSSWIAASPSAPRNDPDYT